MVFFVKTTNTVYAVHQVLKLMIYTFCIILKSVNSAINAFWSREREPLFDCKCGIGVLEAEQFFCWKLFRQIPCQFFCHFVYLLFAAHIGMTDEREIM